MLEFSMAILSESLTPAMVTSAINGDLTRKDKGAQFLKQWPQVCKAVAAKHGLQFRAMALKSNRSNITLVFVPANLPGVNRMVEAEYPSSQYIEV